MSKAIGAKPAIELLVKAYSHAYRTVDKDPVLGKLDNSLKKDIAVSTIIGLRDMRPDFGDL